MSIQHTWVNSSCQCKTIPLCTTMRLKHSFCRSFYIGFVVTLTFVSLHLMMSSDNDDVGVETVHWARNINLPVMYSDIVDKDEWRRLHSSRHLKQHCPNCSSSSPLSTNSTTENSTTSPMFGNLTEDSFRSYEEFLLSQITRLNRQQTVRNLDRFDLSADSDGTVVIVVQVMRNKIAGYLNGFPSCLQMLANPD